MASNTTINGYNTGLDIKSIVSTMVAAEKAPKEDQLKRLESASTAKFTGIGQLKSAIADLQSVLKDLNSGDLFQKRTATASDATRLSATASTTALSGSYSIAVERLASSSKVATAAFASGYTASAGTLTVKLGADDTGVDVSIAAGASLSQVRDALNAQLGDKGITANIVSNPADGTSRLVLSGQQTGDGKDIFIDASAGLESFQIGDSATGTIGALDTASGSSSGYMTQALNAKFSIDGLALQSASNSVDGAIDGVTFNLLSTTDAGKPITLTVGQDKAGVKDNVKKFVDAYNKLMDVASSLTSVTSVGDDKAPVTGALVGDATVRQLLASVRNELVKPATGNDGLRMLADMGITTQKDGKLAIDDTKLSKVLDTQFESVAKLFTGDDGLMKRLDGKLDPYTQTGGLLQQRLDGLQSTLKSVDTQREALTRRMDQMQTRLLAQFNAMDSLVGQLTQTSDRLAQAFNSLPGLVKKD